MQFTPNGKKTWDLWIQLIDGRPPRDQYIFGADIAAGAGGDWSSQSVLSVWNMDGIQVASFARHDITPVDFAILTMAAYNWFTRDHRRPLVVPEANAGGGKLFVKTLAGLGCQRIYAPPQRADRETGQRQKKLGYFNSDTFETLSPLIHELTASTIAPRDAKMLDAAAEYIYDRNGKAVHPKAQIAEDGSSRGLNHGDRAIAGALAVRGIKSLNGLKPIKVKSNPLAHNRMLAKGERGTLAHRILEAQRREREHRRSEFEF